MSLRKAKNHQFSRTHELLNWVTNWLKSCSPKTNGKKSWEKLKKSKIKKPHPLNRKTTNYKQRVEKTTIIIKIINRKEIKRKTTKSGRKKEIIEVCTIHSPICIYII